MNENNRYSQDRPEPWEQSSYQTGSTRPRKSYGGIIAVLLVAVIFLGGIVSTLSFLNIHLFRKINAQPDPSGESAFFSQSSTEPSGSADAVPSLSGESISDVTVQLEQSPTSVENIPQEGGMSLQEIYSCAIDSVVSIACTGDTGSSSGTGVVLSADGYIVTNCHVVDGANTISVLFTDETTLSASVVGTDAVSDLAVLLVQADDLTAAQFGDSAALRVGDAVVAIGDPLGVELRGTMTNGIVSAINRDLSTDGRTMTLIQTNAALNSGNSGGPLLNCYGQVIGINTMKIGDYMSAAGVEGLGFAIPSTTVKEVVDQLIRQGYVSGRPSLGITGYTLSAFDQMIYRLPQGLYITEVSSDSDAAAKGISPGDVLLSLNGSAIGSEDVLAQLLYDCQVGDTVRAVVYRSGKQYSLELTVGEAK